MASGPPGGNRSFFRLGHLFDGVEWSLAYVAFLLYTFIVVTFELGIADIAIAAALIGLLLPGQRMRFPAFFIFLVAFCVWAALGYLTTDYPNIVRESVLDLLKLLIVTLVAVSVLRTWPRVRLFMVLTVLWFALYPVRGAIFNYVFGSYTLLGRAIWIGTYENPNDLAALVLLHLGIAAALWVTEPRGLVKLGAAAAVVVLPVVIVMTQSRGALLALMLVVLIVLVGERRRRARAFGAVVLIGIVAVLIAPSGAWERFRGMAALTSVETLDQADEEGSASARFQIWRVAGRIISDHPFGGVGLGAYKYVHGRYAPIEISDHPEDLDFASQNSPLVLARGQRSTHSTYLNVAAETGYPGLCLFLLMVGSVFIVVERAKRHGGGRPTAARKHLMYLELGLVGYMTAGAFGDFASSYFLYMYLALLWAAAVCVRLPRTRGDAVIPGHSSFRNPSKRTHRPQQRKRGFAFMYGCDPEHVNMQ